MEETSRWRCFVVLEILTLRVIVSLVILFRNGWFRLRTGGVCHIGNHDYRRLGLEPKILVWRGMIRRMDDHKGTNSQNQNRSEGNGYGNLLSQEFGKDIAALYKSFVILVIVEYFNVDLLGFILLRAVVVTVVVAVSFEDHGSSCGVDK